MDFTTINSGRGGGIYTPLDPSYLPELYLVYNTDLGKIIAVIFLSYLSLDMLIADIWF